MQWTCHRITACCHVIAAHLDCKDVRPVHSLEVRLRSGAQLLAAKPRCRTDCRHLRPSAVRCLCLFRTARCSQGILEHCSRIMIVIIIMKKKISHRLTSATRELIPFRISEPVTFRPNYASIRTISAGWLTHINS